MTATLRIASERPVYRDQTGWFLARHVAKSQWDKTLNVEPSGAHTHSLAMSTPGVVVPTFNPGSLAKDFITALKGQTPDLDRVIIIDSGSRDGSIESFRAAGFQVHGILPTEFDHGDTRNVGAALSRPADIVVFMTQDAMAFGREAVANIVAPFADESVGLVYGRQLPRDRAGWIESHARLFNYPEVAMSRLMPQAESLGIKAVFNSNAFAAYRVRALDEVGGFPKRIIMGEDQVAAALMLLAGWRIVYEATATIKHSHGYSVMQEFRRYFDIGVFHDSQRDLLVRFGRVGGEGRRFVRSEIKYLLTRAPWRIPEALLRSAMKLVGYQLGRKHRRLPAVVKCQMAMNAAYFRRG
jgi:rhamnosyltransferase